LINILYFVIINNGKKYLYRLYIFLLIGMGATHTYNMVEKILIVALFVALVCSIVICFQVYVVRNGHYTRGFSTWQMPMIFAILADLYFLR